MVKKSKNKNKNAKENVTLDEYNFPSYEEIVAEVRKKAGKRPKLFKGLPEGKWTKQAQRVLSERYLKKDKDGKVVETPEEMCWRVAWDMASAEARWGKGRREINKLARRFYKMLVSREFLPNSPTLMNAGTGNGLQYSACFVLPVEDSLEGIFDALKYQALIHQTGGGTGFAFSRLRPSGSIVRSSQGVASGPVSFMRIFDAATNEIKQGGKRRGANMGILRVDHPDIMEFINCKEEGGITNFNISVGITDQFMQAYKNDEDYELINPESGKVVGKLNAKEVFEEIAQGAWKTGDPGLVFLDRINDSTANPVPSLGPVESTNPCGEQPLYPYDSCNLGSIFLGQFVKEKGKKKVVDWKKLKSVARLATRFLDSVIEMNPYPLQAIRDVSMAIRRVGLGVGGWADMLIELEIPYDSEEALKLGEKVMKTVQKEAIRASEEMAVARGTFPLFSASRYKDKTSRRNSTVTTIAPTGSISIIAGASSGIEPLFAIAFQHIVKDKHLDRTLNFINPKFEEAAKKAGVWNKTVREKVVDHGVVRNIEELPEKIKKVFGTAHDIHHDWHIKHQAAFQKHTENAVSKTINMANKVSKDDIADAYMLAWDTDCKGITVFRDGCKDAQVLNLGVKDGKSDAVTNDQEIDDGEPLIKRPFVVSGATYRMVTPLGTAFITINEDGNGQPLELFINIGKAGSDVNAMAAALGRTISASLRFKGSLTPQDRAQEIISQLSGIAGRRSVGFGPNKVLSLPDAVASAMSKHFKLKFENGHLQNGVSKKLIKGKAHTHGESDARVRSDSAGAVMLAQSSDVSSENSSIGDNDDHTMASAGSHLTLAREAGDVETISSSTQLPLTGPKVTGDICPSCGASALVFEEGCSKCHVCGHSEC